MKFDTKPHESVHPNHETTLVYGAFRSFNLWKIYVIQ